MPKPIAPIAVVVLAAAIAAQTPEVLQYQFNEVRGQAVANTALLPTAPASGTVSLATWQADPGRRDFRGNEAGFGCLGYRGATGGGWINTGWRLSQTGSFTIMFWLRRDPLSTSTNPFGYAFGDVTFRAFAAGAAGQGITFRGSPIGTVDSAFAVTGTPGVWQHLALVVDDSAGVAYWNDNGVPSVNVVAFPPNTFSYTTATTRNFGVGAQGDSGLSTIGLHYDMDDFRYYGRALNQAEILAAMAAENPSAGAFGTACAGTLGNPTIAGNGVPSLGNPLFAIDLGNVEDGRLCACVIGTAPVAFGIADLSPFLGAGCTLQTDPTALLFSVSAAGAAQQPLPIPANPNFHAFHLYAQWLVAGTVGAVSPVLDVNIQ